MININLRQSPKNTTMAEVAQHPINLGLSGPGLAGVRRQLSKNSSRLEVDARG
jgi:hypothetical protein